MKMYTFIYTIYSVTVLHKRVISICTYSLYIAYMYMCMYINNTYIYYNGNNHIFVDRINQNFDVRKNI